MEEANRISRKASEFEGNHEWGLAAQAYRRAAEIYRSITLFDHDPVAMLSLTTLVNKHVRWAEHCERELGRQGLRGIPASKTDLTFQMERDAAGDSGAALPAGEGLYESISAAADFARQSQNEESEFEGFWQYMQNWLADPVAFTRPLLPSGQRILETRAGTNNDTHTSSSPPHGIMESFYFVGSNPEQGASMYGHTLAASTPKVATPLQAVEEVEEPGGEPTLTDNVSAVATELVGTITSAEELRDVSDTTNTNARLDALLEENQRLRSLARHLNERIRTLESAAQENNMLKSSILNFREEFHRHANAVSLPRKYEPAPVYRRVQTPPASGAAAANELVIRQLKSQLDTLSLDNSKQKAQVSKYRERWEKLKESAKRKRQLQEQHIQSPQQ
ncbi:hypothetical protein LPJ66_001727 [Kickxella alabastrina]|uniref:Uncharacterized protein n=1 Tax=Kickxella alabastrina TaxID=61397 RepID=A0ACC1ISI6_9FUNG|nr:hypothetical protein LPJ66_001727 [Kickxella alabastrina]